MDGHHAPPAMGSDRPPCTSISPSDDRCVDYAGHTTPHHSARSRGSRDQEWTDDTGRDGLDAVREAAHEVRSAERRLDMAIANARELGGLNSAIADAAGMKRATYYRRLAQ